MLGFKAGSTLLHRMDVRFKLFIMVAVNLTTIKAQFWGLCLLLVSLQISLAATRLPFLKTLKEVRYFLYLIVFVFLSRAIFLEGEPLFQWRFFAVSREGVFSGFYIAWRLWLVAIAGIIFVHTSETARIKAAVQWYLKPLPFIPEKKVGVILSLMIRFLPFILQKARETADAQKARGVERRKNPVYRLRVFALPLLRSLFENADNLVIAMEARCFNENRTDPALTAYKEDWLSLGISLTLCLLAFYL